MNRRGTIVVGVTGGIGSGKSTVCRMFTLLGVPVYDTDRRAKELMEEDAGLVSAIKAAFGEETYAGGKLDRGGLAGKVFGDKEALARLNFLVHPAVRRDMRRWTEQCGEKGMAYVLVESAILFEAGMRPDMDCVITVSAPEDMRIDRTVGRDGVSREKIKARMANQMTDEERERLSEYVIRNDGRSLVWEQVLALDKKFRDGL